MVAVNFSMCCYRLPVVPPLGRSPSHGSKKKKLELIKYKNKKKERKKERKDVSAPPEALGVRH